MAENSTIEWCNHTFNPWWSCTKVSPGCDHCYAENIARRFGVLWGTGQVRRPASERTWSEPLKWNERAYREGVRRRVFCASMADVFDNEGLQAEREWLWQVIEETTSLDWLLLTKRIGNVMGMIPTRWKPGLPKHVWIGATMVNQLELERDIVKLLSIPAAVHFLSLEPLLGPIDLTRVVIARGTAEIAGMRSFNLTVNALRGAQSINLPGVKWVIVGGESGRLARPMHPGWVQSIRDQCVTAAVPFLFKQWGTWEIASLDNGHQGSKMPDTGERYTWVGRNGKTYNPSAPDGLDCYAMAKVGKSKSGRILDGRTWDEFPRAVA